MQAKQRRLGRVERLILKTVASRQMPVHYLKSIIVPQTSNSHSLHLQRNFQLILLSLKKQDLLTINSGHVNLTQKGSQLMKYLYPFDSPRYYATILVSPDTAAEETGYSLASIKRKKAPLYYINFAHNLYVLKKELNSKIKEKCELFPLVNEYDLPKLIPQLNTSGLMLIMSHAQKTKEGLYHWPDILNVIMLLGKKYFQNS